MGSASGEVGKQPDKVKSKSVKAQPRELFRMGQISKISKRGLTYGSCDEIGQEEDGEGAEELTEVGTSDDVLCPCRVSKDTFSKSGGKIGFQEPVEEESECASTKYQ